MWATCWAPSRASCRAWQVTVTLGDLGSVGVWKASLATLGDLDMAAQIFMQACVELPKCSNCA